MRSFCVLGFLVSFVMLCAHGAPTVTSRELQAAFGTHGYDSFWLNTTAVFMLTNDQNGVHDLFLSTDAGTHWTQPTLPGSGCYVDRIYQDSAQQLIFLGPPQSKCGWQSADGGLTYRSIQIPGLQYLSFHPNLSSWALGGNSDSEVYYTENLGTQWNKINGTAASWILTKEFKNLPMDSIYLIRDGTFGYSFDMGGTFEALIASTSRMYTSANFIYVLSQDQTLNVGRSKDNFNSALFPFGDQVKLFSVSDDVSGATWFLTDESFFWGNIYTAGATGALYIESLQHVLKRDDAFLDFHSVQGLPGVHLANVVVNYHDYHDLQLKTFITYDNGGDWSALSPPDGVMCSQCNLHLHFNYNSVISRPFYSSASTIGVILANGFVGGAVSYENPINLNTYISRDAGRTWQQLNLPTKGPYHFEFGNNGGVLVLAPQGQATSTIYYSLDMGITIMPLPTGSKVWVTKIMTEKTGASSKFFMFVTDDATGMSAVVSLDFGGSQPNPCVSSNYELWAPSDGGSTNPCWLGQQVTYSRRMKNAACNDTRGEQIVSTSICSCTMEDYECDFGFAPEGTSYPLVCAVSGTPPPEPPLVCTGTYAKSHGYRLVPGDVCSGGQDLRPTTVNCPASSSTPKSSSKAWVAIVVVLIVVVVLAIVVFIIYRDPSLREKVLSTLRFSKGTRYSRVNKARSNSLAAEEDFGIHDDLLEDGGEEEDAKVLHDNDISKVSGSPSGRR